MESRDKENIKLKYGICLRKIIDENKETAKANKQNQVRNHKLISSLRKLAASSGVDFGTIQKIASGKKNAAWTTTVQIIEGLDMNMQEWGIRYDKITDEDIKAEFERRKKKKGKKKT